MELKGQFVKLLAEESGVSKSGKDWKKQSFVIEHEPGNFPKQACFECWGDTTDLIQKLKPGQTVTVKFAVESREYNGKYYTGLKALTIDTGTVQADQSTRQAEPVNNDLPF